MRITNPCGNAHFQNARCRECEAIRRNRESSSEIQDASVIGGESQERAYRVESPLGPETPEGVAPLTNAERCRKYRQRHLEDYRERNRERMRKARNG